MLALTRKKGEALVINNNIEITVLEIRGDQIKIGISAPKDVPIYRKEVYLQIQHERNFHVADGLIQLLLNVSLLLHLLDVHLNLILLVQILDLQQLFQKLLKL